MLQVTGKPGPIATGSPHLGMLSPENRASWRLSVECLLPCLSSTKPLVVLRAARTDVQSLVRWMHAGAHVLWSSCSISMGRPTLPQTSLDVDITFSRESAYRPRDAFTRFHPNNSIT